MNDMLFTELGDLINFKFFACRFRVHQGNKVLVTLHQTVETLTIRTYKIQKVARSTHPRKVSDTTTGRDQDNTSGRINPPYTT